MAESVPGIAVGWVWERKMDETQQEQGAMISSPAPFPFVFKEGAHFRKAPDENNTSAWNHIPNFIRIWLSWGLKP